MSTPKRGFFLQAVWASLGQILQIAIALGGMAVLVRILGPEGYGLFAVAMLCLGFSDILVGGHSGQGLVSISELRSTHKNSLFWALVALGIIVACTLWFSQDLIAVALGISEAGPIIGYASILPVITAMTTVPSQLLVRDVRFDALSRASVVGALLGTVVGVTAASFDVGAASLVLMEGARRITILALNLRSATWLPGLEFHRADAIHILGLASRRIENQAIQYVSTEAMPRTFIAMAAGPAALGIYVVSKGLLRHLDAALSGPISAIALPAFAKARGSQKELARILLKAIRASTITFWPALLGLAVVAPIAIPLVFGREMEPAVLIVQLLLIGNLRTPLSGFTNALLIALNRNNAITALHLQGAAIGIVLLSIGMTWGLAGMALALSLRQWIVWPIAARVIEREIGLSPRVQLQTLLASAAPAVIMAILIASFQFISPWWLTDSYKLAALIILGALSYAICLGLFLAEIRQSLREGLRLLKLGRFGEAARMVGSGIW